MSADRSHKFSRLLTKSIQWSQSPRYATPTAGAEWCGITNVMSTTVVISTTAVASGAFVGMTFQAMDARSIDLGINSGGLPSWIVRSVNPSNAFVIGTVYSYALTSSYRVHWTLATKV